MNNHTHREKKRRENDLRGSPQRATSTGNGKEKASLFFKSYKGDGKETRGTVVTSPTRFTTE